MSRFFLLPIVGVLFLSSFGKFDYCKYSSKIVGKYTKELASKHHLFTYGYGGSMMDDVKLVQLCLSGEKQVDVDEARGLFIEVAEELISRFNSDEKIRPYLHNYPFTFRNIKVSFSFQGEYGQYPGGDYVAYMSTTDSGKLFYCGYDVETKQYHDLHSEPYAEAVSIVKGK